MIMDVTFEELNENFDLNYDENIDLGEGSGESYTLPIATPNTLGGVQPIAKTAEMTQSVGVDAEGGLWTVPGGGSGGIPIPETAEVGQTIVVKAVDENGKPTEWECADFPEGSSGGWKILTDQTTTEDVASLTATFDEVSEIVIVFGCKLSSESDTAKNTCFYINGKNCSEFSYFNNNYRYHLLHLVYTGFSTHGIRTATGGEAQLYNVTRVHGSKAAAIPLSRIADSGASTITIRSFDSNTRYLAGAKLFVYGR